jgi:hypothetical protein
MTVMKRHFEEIQAVARHVDTSLRAAGCTEIEVWYRHGTGDRRLRVFPGGWWDSEVRRDHGGERGPRP